MRSWPSNLKKWLEANEVAPAVDIAAPAPQVAAALADLPIDFDEAGYLRENPDVAAAIALGSFKSGAEHFRRYGSYERRAYLLNQRASPYSLPFPLAAQPSRRDKILAGIDLRSSSGAEIGALNKPLVRQAEGEILYVDYADTDHLKRHYSADQSVDIDAIVEVDAIWGERTLADCLGGRTVDYVVASHVIEHTPDLITWLEEIRSILRPGGTLRLAVPDRLGDIQIPKHG
jgi:SAM-dependent methyltransferase